MKKESIYNIHFKKIEKYIGIKYRCTMKFSYFKSKMQRNKYVGDGLKQDGDMFD